jgi:hypothetical protein
VSAILGGWSSWSYGVMVSTLDFESSDPGSNPGRTSFLSRGWGCRRLVFVRTPRLSSLRCMCASRLVDRESGRRAGSERRTHTSHHRESKSGAVASIVGRGGRVGVDWVAQWCGWKCVRVVVVCCFVVVCVGSGMICVLYGRRLRSYGVMVSTLDSESSDPGSNPGRTSLLFPKNAKRKTHTLNKRMLSPLSLYPSLVRSFEHTNLLFARRPPVSTTESRPQSSDGAIARILKPAPRSGIELV